LFTVALVGADGAGKTTIARRVLQQQGLDIRYVYMGANAESSNIMLPTTRLALRLKRMGRPQAAKPALRGAEAPPTPPRRGLKRLLAAFKPALWLVHHVSEEWFRQGVVWWYLLRGSIVLFDRHFYFDYYASDIQPNGAGRPWHRRLHGWMLRRVFPRPDLVIFLDAPAGLLHARKPETTLDYLERRREEYARFRDHFPNFWVVDAAQPEEAVLQDVLRIIETFRPGRSRQAARGETG